jgi:uncharacterized protein (TIGR02996 family)
MTLTDDTLDGLLLSICRNTDDTEARLVYADALEENGGDLRAEFIRVQCRIADTEAGIAEATAKGTERWAVNILRYQLQELRRRERELLVGHRWPVGNGYFSVITAGYYEPTRPLMRLFPPGGGPEIANVEWRRGFVESVKCPCAAWEKHGAAIVPAQPVERVTLTDAEPNVLPGGVAIWYAHVGGARGRTELPREWFDLLDASLERTPKALPVKRYDTRDLALPALSAAALLWARIAAGLEVRCDRCDGGGLLYGHLAIGTKVPCPKCNGTGWRPADATKGGGSRG